MPTPPSSSSDAVPYDAAFLNDPAERATIGTPTPSVLEYLDIANNPETTEPDDKPIRSAEINALLKRDQYAAPVSQLRAVAKAWDTETTTEQEPSDQVTITVHDEEDVDDASTLVTQWTDDQTQITENSGYSEFTEFTAATAATPNEAPAHNEASRNDPPALATVPEMEEEEDEYDFALPEEDEAKWQAAAPPPFREPARRQYEDPPPAPSPRRHSRRRRSSGSSASSSSSSSLSSSSRRRRHRRRRRRYEDDMEYTQEDLDMIADHERMERDTYIAEIERIEQMTEGAVKRTREITENTSLLTLMSMAKRMTSEASKTAHAKRMLNILQWTIRGIEALGSLIPQVASKTRGLTKAHNCKEVRLAYLPHLKAIAEEYLPRYGENPVWELGMTVAEHIGNFLITKSCTGTAPEVVAPAVTPPMTTGTYPQNGAHPPVYPHQPLTGPASAESGEAFDPDEERKQPSGDGAGHSSATERASRMVEAAKVAADQRIAPLAHELEEFKERHDARLEEARETGQQVRERMTAMEVANSKRWADMDERMARMMEAVTRQAETTEATSRAVTQQAGNMDAFSAKLEEGLQATHNSIDALSTQWSSRWEQAQEAQDQMWQRLEARLQQVEQQPRQPRQLPLPQQSQPPRPSSPPLTPPHNEEDAPPRRQDDAETLTSEALLAQHITDDWGSTSDTSFDDDSLSMSDVSSIGSLQELEQDQLQLSMEQVSSSSSSSSSQQLVQGPSSFSMAPPSSSGSQAFQFLQETPNLHI